MLLLGVLGVLGVFGVLGVAFVVVVAAVRRDGFLDEGVDNNEDFAAFAFASLCRFSSCSWLDVNGNSLGPPVWNVVAGLTTNTLFVGVRWLVW